MCIEFVSHKKEEGKLVRQNCIEMEARRMRETPPVAEIRVVQLTQTSVTRMCRMLFCVAGGSHVGYRHAAYFQLHCGERYMCLTFTADPHIFYIQCS